MRDVSVEGIVEGFKLNVGSARISLRETGHKARGGVCVCVCMCMCMCAAYMFLSMFICTLTGTQDEINNGLL